MSTWTRPTTYHLTSTEANEVEKCAAGLLNDEDPDLWRPDVARVVAARSAELPTGLATAVRVFRSATPRSGALLVRGLECLAEDRPTPLAPGSYEDAMSLPAAATLLVAAALGEPVSFRSEKSGALVHNVVPVPGREAEQSNAGSATALKMHVENAFHEHRPDHLVLACVRSDPTGDAGLRVSSIRNAVDDLPEDVVAALRRRQYLTERPPSFGGGRAVEHAVLSGDPCDPNVCVDFAATRPGRDAPEVTEPLHLLEEAIEAHTETLRLSVGDVAVVDNRVALHGRTSFRPRYDGTDRWLHRVYVSLDARRTRGDRLGDSFVID